jgi:hypothetical protein
VLADGLEELSDKALGCPVSKTDLTAGLADARHFGRGAVLIGGEHHAECGDHNIEAIIAKQQRFSVGLAKLDVESFSCGAFASTLQQRWHIVSSDHFAPATRSCKGGVPIARGNVEHSLSCAQVDGFA